MRLRHILEYEDHEIRGLLGDLEGIGQADKRTYCLWVDIPGFTFHTGYIRKLRLPVALGNPFWSKGSPLEDGGIILDSLQRGNFEVPELSGLDRKTLSAPGINGIDSQGKHSLRRRASRSVMKFLDPSSLQDFFRGQEGKTLGQTLESLRERMTGIIQEGADMPLEVGVVLVYGRPGDPDLLLTPDASLYHASLNKERVVLEDLTNEDRPRIYLRDL